MRAAYLGGSSSVLPASCLCAIEQLLIKHSVVGRRYPPAITVRESSGKLGRHRWVVESTQVWPNHYRRLSIRYERREDIHQAFATLGCSLVCFNYLQRMFLKAL